MSVDQLLPQVLALDPFEREQLFLQISESIGEREGYFVPDSDVEQRVSEIEENPEESTVSKEEFISSIDSHREARRSERK